MYSWVPKVFGSTTPPQSGFICAARWSTGPMPRRQ